MSRRHRASEQCAIKQTCITALSLNTNSVPQQYKAPPTPSGVDHWSAGKSHQKTAQKRYLEVDGQKGSVPIIGNVHQVVVSIVHTAAGHMPNSLQGCFAQQGTSEGDGHPVAAIDVLPEMVIAGMVYKDVIHAIYVAMKIANLQSNQNLSHSVLAMHNMHNLYG